jgi:hypothetical protein
MSASTKNAREKFLLTANHVKAVNDDRRGKHVGQDDRLTMIAALASGGRELADAIEQLENDTTHKK